MFAQHIRDDGGSSSRGEREDVPWWSFTKLVIATAALRLVEQDRLCLDALVDGQAFTLRQLLQHEAGLPDYGCLEEYQLAIRSGDQPWTADELIPRTFRVYQPNAPGAGWGYSNIGYYYVGQLISERTGQELGEALRVLVFAPAGVQRARMASTPEGLDDVQMGRVEYDPRWVLHGLLVGPLAEAAQFLYGLLTGRIISSELLGEMMRVRSLPQFADQLWDRPGYGLGMMASSECTSSPCGHSGEGPGSAIAVYGHTINGRTIVAAFWQSPGSSRDVEAAALRALAP